jgi:hypothetical protein
MKKKSAKKIEKKKQLQKNKFTKQLEQEFEIKFQNFDLIAS